ncbi:hypothetical protein VSH64_13050 [Amycolatopsis rhabdoformis]|uniref:Uncharacterized protein n=1 Tax=Amycolatopsis rhabdoformis TaxID=1448059 RepID=A0ABZ1IF02_9PSEU|nr:hypothetical protein [Amycolatopsis rhabdoformis]WSE33031.1 hypothetical protein VSH64_13050 [Amycolatopsis rhabdoformis]
MPLNVADIISYLAQTGWEEQDPHDLRGTSTWHHPDDFEVSVPIRDGMGDGERRVREILRCLAEVEDRPIPDLAQEISRPYLDKQLFRTFPVDHDSGYTSLESGFQAVKGVRDLLATAARTALQGPHFAFAGRSPAAVGDLVRAAELGPSRAGSYVIEIRLSANATARTTSDEQLDGRMVLVQLHEAVAAAQTAVLTDRPAAFDDAVTAGVSAELCTALSGLSGSDGEPFEVTFRWARARPHDAPSSALAFPAHAEPLLKAAAARLRGLNASGPASVTGTISWLHDDDGGGDRWRIKVDGTLRTEHDRQSPRKSVWVRLPDQITYDRAIAAHREHRQVSVSGELSSTTGRVELVPGRDLEI